MIDLLCRRCGFLSAAQIVAVRAGWEGNIGGIEEYRGNESLNNAYYAGAVGGGHLSIVERLLEQGASPNEGRRRWRKLPERFIIEPRWIGPRGADMMNVLPSFARPGEYVVLNCRRRSILNIKFARNHPCSIS